MAKSKLKNLLINTAGGSLGRGVFRALRRQHVPVFMLHRMRDEQTGMPGHAPEMLDQALAYLASRGYRVVSLSDLVAAIDGEKALPDNAVVFTMDDGFHDQLSIAAPIFARHNAPVSIFLLGSFSSGESWPWDYKVEFLLNSTEHNTLDFIVEDQRIECTIVTPHGRRMAKRALRDRLKSMRGDVIDDIVRRLADTLEVDIDAQPPENYRPITWSDARAKESALVQFGAHSINHLILAQQSDEVAKREIEQSWQRVQQELENPLDVFCYPTGRLHQDFSGREMAFVEELGFRAALSVTPGYVSIGADGQEGRRYCLPRFAFPEDLESFIQLCSWIELVKEKVRARL